MIRDKIKVMDLSNPRSHGMLRVHGRTKIELFDGLTGKLKERIEENNMFTSAIDQMVNFALKHNYTSAQNNSKTNGLTRILNNHLDLVSGLLLFSTALDTDPDGIWAPASAELVGCGATDYTSIDANLPMMGAYNSTESQSDTLMRSWVWDFQTSQANGTISTACLTSKTGGKVGYGSSSQMGSSALPFGNITSLIGLGNIVDGSRYGRYAPSYNRSCVPLNGSYADFCIDSENDLKYMFSVHGTELRILSHKMSPENFDLFRSVRSIQPATVETYAGNFSSAYYYKFYNSDEKVLYFWGYSSETESAGNFTITVNKFDMESKTLTMNYDSATVPSNIILYLNSIAITANGIYAFGLDYSVVYKHTRGGGSGFATIEIASSVNGASGQNDGAYILNNILYLGGYLQLTSSSNTRREVMINLTDDSILFRPWQQTLSVQSYSSDNRAVLVPPINNKQLVFGASLSSGSVLSTTGTASLELATSECGVNTFTNYNYLATKNVLSSPVVKTSDKTMKVTYTITGEELE